VSLDDRAVRIAGEVQKAALSFGIAVQRVEVQSAADFDRAFQAAANGRAGAVLIAENPLFTANSARLSALAMKHRLPAIALLGVHAESGLLMTYGPDLAAVLRRAATYIDKILKGAKPGDLPVEQPSRFELVVNLKTANALGLTIPQSVLIRADRVLQ
jgi:putative ABC transport system substrate-binding protein